MGRTCLRLIASRSKKLRVFWMAPGPATARTLVSSIRRPL